MFGQAAACGRKILQQRVKADGRRPAGPYRTLVLPSFSRRRQLGSRKSGSHWDSPLEGGGFEPSVPHEIGYDSEGRVFSAP